MKEQYFYPSIIRFDGEKYEARFPDFEDCRATGLNRDEILRKAKRVLGERLFQLESEKLVLPEPSDIHSIDVQKNEMIFVLDIHMPLYRVNDRDHAIKKTLTIPAWLNNVALENDVNFSRVLQDALKTELKSRGIKIHDPSSNL
ncbi:type II toxin-antitoxin system HicB family antitoxin [Bacillus luti]|nr:type II toxin-antitoxin system HicB family antitoxin [Bacillus cereus]HDR8327218.1 type II toxin-antitoxin system HicB family antitoxin [Bacillus cereus]HDR8336408.1 type II toxin-antitoxin system HicB family antitoxin [Bacillus cereus]